jgi:hypothetical protein
VARMEDLHMRYQALYIIFTIVHRDCSNEYTPNTVNVFQRDVRLPGRYEVSLAATTPCRLQLCTVLGRSAITNSRSLRYQSSHPSRLEPEVLNFLAFRRVRIGINGEN